MEDVVGRPCSKQRPLLSALNKLRSALAPRLASSCGGRRQCTPRKSELAALMQQLAARESYEEYLRQALQDADVVLREQVAKAYLD